MLAEKKKKQKWCLNPRGKEWSEDANKFGQKLLERMGWSKGKGLGIRENGVTEHVKVTFKNDTKGMGFREDENPWTENEVEYSKFLKRLSSNQGYNSQLGSDGASDNSESNENPKVESLEKKSEQSRTRVHYKKFTRGKDLSQYSNKDLACIFGKSVATTIQKNTSNEAGDNVVTSSTDGDTEKSDLGNNLIAGGCMDKYFANKMRGHKSKFEIRQSKSNDINGTDVTSQTLNGSTDIVDNSINYREFQEAQTSMHENSKDESTNTTPCDSTVVKKPKKKKKSKEQSSETVENGEIEHNEIDERKKSKKKSKKHSKNSKPYQSGIDNPALNLNSSDNEIETESFEYSSCSPVQIKNVKTSDKISSEPQGIDNPALNLEDSSEIVPVATVFEVKRKKKRKNDITQPHEDEQRSSKKLKRDKHTEVIDPAVSPPPVQQEQFTADVQIKVKKRKRNNYENTVDIPAEPPCTKKKKKSKLTKDGGGITMYGIENAALQLSSEDNSPTSSTDIKKSKKKHKKDKHRSKLHKPDSSITIENAQFGYENPAYNSNTSNCSQSNNMSEVQSTPKSVLKKNVNQPSSATKSTRKSVQINESMNQEKFITDSENSFGSTNTDDDSISKRIDNYQNELENALNEQKHENIKTATATATANVTSNVTVTPKTVTPKDYTAQKFKYIALHHLAKGESTIAFPGVSIQRMISGYGSPKN